MPANGGSAIQVDSGWASFPAVSPDGKLVAAFYEPQPESLQLSPRSIAIIPTKGDAPAQMLPIDHSVEYIAGVRWTADGHSVSYVKTEDGVSNVWIHPINGGAPSRITNLKGDKLTSFDWSADGKRLAFVRVNISRDALLLTAHK
jgi:Tol biopolymer transport system component